MLIIFNAVFTHSEKGRFSFSRFIITFLIVFGLGANNLNLAAIRESHTMINKGEASFFYLRKHNSEILKRLDDQFPATKNTVVFNCRPLDNIPLMFYNDVVAAYPYFPNKKTIHDIKRKGYKLSVFDKGDLPDFILNDDEIYKINSHYK